MKTSEPPDIATGQPSVAKPPDSTGQIRYFPLSEPLDSHWTENSGMPLDTPALSIVARLVFSGMGALARARCAGSALSRRQSRASGSRQRCRAIHRTPFSLTSGPPVTLQ
jgi:hypothetical protein